MKPYSEACFNCGKEECRLLMRGEFYMKAHNQGSYRYVCDDCYTKYKNELDEETCKRCEHKCEKYKD